MFLQFTDDYHTKLLYCVVRCFRAMVENVEVQLYKRRLKERANCFHKETALSTIFYKWWREAQFRQDLRMLQRVVRTYILHP